MKAIKYTPEEEAIIKKIQKDARARYIKKWQKENSKKLAAYVKQWRAKKKKLTN